MVAAVLPFGRSSCVTTLLVVLGSIAAFALPSCSAAEFVPAVPNVGLVDDAGTEGGDVSTETPGPVTGTRDPEPSEPPLAATSAVSIQVQPSDSGAALLATIRGAKKSVHVTIYLLTNDAIIDALGDAKQAGRDVKVLLNKSFPSDKDENLPAFNALKARGVEVQWAPAGYTFTHAKTLLIDGENAIIMTMNMTETSARTNREYIATDSDPKDVDDLEKIFAADMTNKSVTVESKLVVSPAGGNKLHSARAHLKQLIDSAKTTLDVEVQSLSDTTIVDAIILAHQASIDVRVVVDAQTLSSRGQKAAAAKLKQYGVPLRGLKNPDMHAKAIVVDGALTFIGSHNMTATALDQNREVGLITDSKPESTKVSQVIRGDFDKAQPL